MSEQEILDRARRIAIENSGKQWGYLMTDMIEDLPTLQEFAKALWGDTYGDDFGPGFAWQHHLQMLVIDPNPIEYLGENI